MEKRKTSFWESYFKLSENNTNVKTEVIAGITTFLTMAYIIAVNPMLLSTTGMDKGALVTATCITAGFATIFMGFYANLPFALASGMGLNAFFAFSVCAIMKVHWSVALTAVFVEGLIFIILSLTKIRELVVNSIPASLKIAVSAGIGLFIAFIGFQNSKIVVADKNTLVALGNFGDPRVLICVIGIIITGVLVHRNVKGSILWGILSSTIVAWIFALVKGPELAAQYEIFLPTGLGKVYSIAPIAGKLDFSFISNSEAILGFASVVLTFLFVDFFDTIGTLAGVATKANMIDEKGNVKNAKKALLVDAIGTTIGATLGVSTVTTYVESSAGVAEGGRTGLTAVVAGVLFLISLLFAPIFMAIPSCATAPALIMVGLFMMQNITNIDFYDFTEAIPAFLTIILMPLTYSIANGLMMGTIAYVIFNIFGGKKEKVSVTMVILAVLFVIRLLTLSV
ncbi:guanine/hypoxanthine permease PbuG [Clostridium acetireducens DSM 10703]|uniref:Guanine/hypoxanthine permease PbuG n=1 Tax=Clostridium acetireducens DSM 10703 TaxID=1121290 RepID=A0A1E8EZX0_9CLOT|nr:NCS2 family permease [Clostridium acetireducens]OFI06277.1 guanine/hypoxanthine permease PbuG [Clostridium acetireducens DSM 10703]